MAPAGEKKVGVHSDQSWIMHTLCLVFVYYVSRHVAWLKNVKGALNLNQLVRASCNEMGVVQLCVCCFDLICVLTSRQNILKRLDAGEVVIGDGGFVFALEKRGYVKAGPWTPEAAAEHPEAGRTLLALHLKLKCWSSSFVSAEWGVLCLQCGSCTESSWELVPMSCRRSLSTQAMTN